MTSNFYCSEVLNISFIFLLQRTTWVTRLLLLFVFTLVFISLLYVIVSSRRYYKHLPALKSVLHCWLNVSSLYREWIITFIFIAKSIQNFIWSWRIMRSNVNLSLEVFSVSDLFMRTLVHKPDYLVLMFMSFVIFSIYTYSL